MINARGKEILRTAAVAAAAVILLVYSSLFYFRLDLTDNRLYSLTKVSRTISKKLPQPVRITYYKTRGIEGIFPGVTEVTGLLDEFVKTSKGKISLEIVDPDSGVGEKVLESEGILPQSVRIIRENRKVDLKVYSSVRIDFLDRKRVINFIYDASNLEYQVVSAIRELVQNRRRVIGLLLGDRSRTLENDYSILTGALSRDFDLVQIMPDDTSAPGINVLLVLGSRDITNLDVLKIKSFIESGGNVFFAAEGVYVDMTNNLAAEPLKDNPLLELLSGYGITVRTSLVLDPVSKEFRIPRNFYGDIAWKTVGPYPEWISVKNAASKDSPVTAHFQGVDLLWGSPITVDTGRNGGSEILFTSSTLSWEMNSPFRTDPFTVNEYGAGENAEHSRKILGVSAVKGKSRIIVVGDADFLSDLITYTESYKNMNFIINAADWLSQNEDFMEIRTRRERNLTLDILPDDRKLSVYSFSEVLNMVIIPVLVLITGFIITGRKKKT